MSNPADYKYKDLIGKTVVIPLTGREIPIIADEYVDKSFGTGAVKITPAHDPNDYEVGKRHNLKPIWVIDEKGNMIYMDFVAIIVWRDIMNKVENKKALFDVKCSKSLADEIK